MYLDEVVNNLHCLLNSKVSHRKLILHNPYVDFHSNDEVLIDLAHQVDEYQTEINLDSFLLIYQTNLLTC